MSVGIIFEFGYIKNDKSSTLTEGYVRACAIIIVIIYYLYLLSYNCIIRVFDTIDSKYVKRLNEISLGDIIFVQWTHVPLNMAGFP